MRAVRCWPTPCGQSKARTTNLRYTNLTGTYLWLPVSVNEYIDVEGPHVRLPAARFNMPLGTPQTRGTSLAKANPHQAPNADSTKQLTGTVIMLLLVSLAALSATTAAATSTADPTAPGPGLRLDTGHVPPWLQHLLQLGESYSSPTLPGQSNENFMSTPAAEGLSALLGGAQGAALAALTSSFQAWAAAAEDDAAPEPPAEPPSAPYAGTTATPGSDGPSTQPAGAGAAGAQQQGDDGPLRFLRSAWAGAGADLLFGGMRLGEGQQQQQFGGLWQLLQPDLAELEALENVRSAQMLEEGVREHLGAVMRGVVAALSHRQQQVDNEDGTQEQLKVPGPPAVGSSTGPSAVGSGAGGGGGTGCGGLHQGDESGAGVCGLYGDAGLGPAVDSSGQSLQEVLQGMAVVLAAQADALIAAAGGTGSSGPAAGSGGVSDTEAGSGGVPDAGARGVGGIEDPGSAASGGVGSGPPLGADLSSGGIGAVLGSQAQQQQHVLPFMPWLQQVAPGVASTLAAGNDESQPAGGQPGQTSNGNPFAAQVAGPVAAEGASSEALAAAPGSRGEQGDVVKGDSGRRLQQIGPETAGTVGTGAVGVAGPGNVGNPGGGADVQGSDAGGGLAPGALGFRPSDSAVRAEGEGGLDEGTAGIFGAYDTYMGDYGGAYEEYAGAGYDYGVGGGAAAGPGGGGDGRGAGAETGFANATQAVPPFWVSPETSPATLVSRRSPLASGAVPLAMLALVVC